MPQAVYTIWTILLIVAILAAPLLVYLLHRTWQAARSIERYLREMRVAGEGIAENTGHIEALEETADTGDALLSTAGDIDAHAATIEDTLEERASLLGGRSPRD